MIIFEVYSDQQSEQVNGGGKCHSDYFSDHFSDHVFDRLDSVFKARFACLEGKIKANIMQINRIVIGNC